MDGENDSLRTTAESLRSDEPLAPIRYTRLWIGLVAVIVGSFAVLGYYGRELYRQAPPVPERVVTTDGGVLFTGQDIQDGQNVWQSMGGQEVGTVWGHGAYVAPDWSADWLHREATWLLDHWARAEHGKSVRDADGRGAGRRCKARLQARAPDQHLRPGDRRPGRLARCGPRRSRPSARTTPRCSATIRQLDKLRDAYAIPANALNDPERHASS